MCRVVQARAAHAWDAARVQCRAQHRAHVPCWQSTRDSSSCRLGVGREAGTTDHILAGSDALFRHDCSCCPGLCSGAARLGATRLRVGGRRTTADDGGDVLGDRIEEPGDCDELAGKSGSRILRRPQLRRARAGDRFDFSVQIWWAKSGLYD